MPLCMGCLNEISSTEEKCAHCGFDNTREQVSPFLPFGTILTSKYVVAKNLDTNGESTRYLGYDNSSGRVVTIREFLPIGLFDRKQGETEVVVSKRDEESYIEAKEEFLNYYNVLSSITDNSAMIKILEIFETNNTVYVVEESNELIPFSEYLEKSYGTIDWEDARPLFMPIISLLETLHKNDIGHYAVSPSNLFVTSKGVLKLSGFSSENERKRGTMLKSQLYSGCAAPEQYKDNNKLDIDTDIYGFTATLFYALTGNLPANAKERLKDPRLLISTNIVKKLPPFVVTALANGLQMRRDSRISDFDDLRSQLSVSSTVQAIQDEISKTASMTPIQKEELRKAQQGKVKPFYVGLVATIVALLLFGAAGFYWLSINPLKGLFTKSTAETQMVSTEEPWTGAVFSNYVGMSIADVNAAAEAEGITVKISADGEFSDTVEKDKVISQVPKAGEPISANNAIVSVVLSKGPELVQLPDCANKSLTSQAEKLTSLGFVVLQEEEYSSSVKAGYIIDYSSGKAGDKVESGSEITVRVSKGKQPENSDD